MKTPADFTETLAKAMSNVGYDISEQFRNALEEEFAAALKADQEEGNFTSLDTFLDALEYGANRVTHKYNNE